jgi:hypothetical protein
LGVLPVFELRRANVKIAIRYLAEMYVLRTDPKISRRITHRRGAVAAASRLMEHERAVLRLQAFDDLDGLFGDLDSMDHFASLEKEGHKRMMRLWP